MAIVTMQQFMRQLDIVGVAHFGLDCLLIRMLFIQSTLGGWSDVITLIPSFWRHAGEQPQCHGVRNPVTSILALNLQAGV